MGPQHGDRAGKHGTRGPTSSGQMGYNNGGKANVFAITFATQQLSGTYTMTLGTGIVAADAAVPTLGGIQAPRFGPRMRLRRIAPI